MSASRLDTEIAALYNLPLADFTAARNVLAKGAGARAAEVRALQKPPVAAWAINQLFWEHRDIYDRLIGSAADLRAAHAAVLAGKRGDVRSAGKSHEEALEEALARTLGLLRDAGQPVTDATRQAIATTLRALPGPEAAGQLTKTLQPGGFELLAGLPVSGKSTRAVVTPRPASPTQAAQAPRPRADAGAIRRAKEAAAQAERDVRLAEHAARREEFEAGRASREARKAQDGLVSARELAKEAQEALAAAEAAAEKAIAAQREAEERARVARAALEAAQDRAKALRTRA
jgi:hypothetical protein